VSNQVGIRSGNSSEVLVNGYDDPFEAFFKIYQKVNAKSELIQKAYKNNIIINFNDVKELHQKTMQSIASLNPAGSVIGIRISISHNEGEVDKFNRFEAFENHNITSPNPTASVDMEYTFSIYAADTENFENYKITNKIASRIAQLKQLESEAPSFISRAIFSSMVTVTAQIVIEYSDYVKARHFTAMFDEWIKGCDECPSSKALDRLKEISHHIANIGRLFIFALLAYFTIKELNGKLISIEDSIKFLIAYASIFVIVGGLSSTLMRGLENSIDSYSPISYLNLNKGDAKLLKEYQERNKKSFRTGAINLLGAIFLSFITKGTYDLIRWLLQ
jgi:hypothetical protein